MPRFNAQLAVQGDMLYIYGGTYENGDREFTFNELWSLDLGKLDGVREVFRREIEDRNGEQSDEDEEDDEDEYESESDEDEERPETPALSEAPTLPSTVDQDEPEEEAETKPADTRPQPRPFETLREFFARTSNTWQEAVLEAMKYKRDVDHTSVKEIRKQAFDMAEQKWWDMREEIQALEDEQARLHHVLGTEAAATPARERAQEVCRCIIDDVHGAPVAKRASQNLAAAAVLLRVGLEPTTLEEK